MAPPSTLSSGAVNVGLAQSTEPGRRGAMLRLLLSQRLPGL